ncbi:MAG: hypothetical protein J6R18_10625 [Kiritimatiellae bacterium]|nr:hypothetical protein [Kiritimatiellia bacterium]
MGIFAKLIVSVFCLCAISGCTHTTYVADSKHPEVEFSEDGGLKWRGKFIELEELPELLEDAGVSKKSQIDIRVSERMRSLKAPRVLLFILRRAGYTRGVLVTEKRAYSEVANPPPAAPQRHIQPQKGKIRYK